MTYELEQGKVYETKKTEIDLAALVRRRAAAIAARDLFQSKADARQAEADELSGKIRDIKAHTGIDPEAQEADRKTDRGVNE